LGNSDDSRDWAVEQGSAAEPLPSAGRSDGTQGKPYVGLARPARGFVRFLYSSNPFYILSADLVFVGLRMSFGAGAPASRSWALLVGLAGYTLLMATTACFLIRVGKLWDDLRSLLILVVMMFMAMALCGDETMAADPRRGVVSCAGGFLFAVVVTEAVLRTIRLRLPGWYRAAYYLILGLVFLYPIALSPFLNEPEGPRLQWGLFGFSVLAGLVLTTLVPAARAGAALVAGNGSPWRWPLYPWSLFVVMAFGLGVRCYSLCVSFHYVGGSHTIFGPYFLVPIGLAVSLIWLEIGIASRRRPVMVAAAAVPLLLAGLAMTGHRYEAVYMHFLDMFMGTLGGSPAFLTLVAAILFLAYAAARRVPLAWELIAVGLTALAVVGPKTITPFDTVSPRSLPLLAAGLVLGSVAARRRSSGRAVLAVGLLVAGMTRGQAELWPHTNLVPLAVHISIVAMLVVSVAFDDWLADLARVSGAFSVLVLGVGSAFDSPWTEVAIPGVLSSCYPLLAVVLTWTFGFLMRDRMYLAIAAIDLAAWLMHSGSEFYQQLRRVVVGLDQITFGMVFFLIALAISLRKAGIGLGFAAKAIVRILADCNHFSSRESGPYTTAQDSAAKTSDIDRMM
jgi:hypothetical protein